MHTFFSDVAYALRGLRKSLGFATVATITIALGVGACTAIFSVCSRTADDGNGARRWISSKRCANERTRASSR